MSESPDSYVTKEEAEAHLEGWRSIEHDQPDWGCPAAIQVRVAGGESITCDVDVDTAFDGESDFPLFTLTKDDDTTVSLFDFDEWRPAPTLLTFDIESHGLYPYQQAAMDIMMRWSAPDRLPNGLRHDSPWTLEKTVAEPGFDFYEGVLAPKAFPIILAVDPPRALFDRVPLCASFTPRPVTVTGTAIPDQLTVTSSTQQIVAGVDELIGYHSKKIATYTAVGIVSAAKIAEHERMLDTLVILRRKLTE